MRQIMGAGRVRVSFLYYIPYVSVKMWRRLLLGGEHPLILRVVVH